MSFQDEDKVRRLIDHLPAVLFESDGHPLLLQIWLIDAPQAVIESVEDHVKVCLLCFFRRPSSPLLALISRAMPTVRLASRPPPLSVPPEGARLPRAQTQRVSLSVLTFLYLLPKQIIWSEVRCTDGGSTLGSSHSHQGQVSARLLHLHLLRAVCPSLSCLFFACFSCSGAWP